MGYVGAKPSAVPLTSADITDGIITSAKIADGTIVNADINASAGIVTSKLSGSLGVAGITTSSTSGTALNITASNDLEISAGKKINFVTSTPPVINIDNSDVTVTLAANATIDYTSNSGIFFMCDHTNSGQSAMFTTGGGGTQLSGGAGFFTTSSSPSNAIGFFYNSGTTSYRLKNGASISLTISIFNIKLRNSA